MSDSFDPYRVWLGIPPESRPPTHYEMLGISPNEQERAVIEAAVLRQSGYVRNFQIGKYGKDAARLLNEIGAAKTCLIDPAKRAKYDAELKARQQAPIQTASQATQVPIAMAPVLPSAVDLDLLAATAAPPAPHPGQRHRTRALTLKPRRRKTLSVAWQLTAGVGVSVCVLLAALAFWPKSAQEPPQPQRDAIGTVVRTASVKPDRAATEPPAVQREPHVESARSASPPSPPTVSSSIAAAAKAVAPRDRAKDWTYGYARIEGDAIFDFRPFPCFIDSRWRGGAAYPDPQLGSACLHAQGGHPAFPHHAIIRRWVSPLAGVVSVKGTLPHGADYAPSDGVRGRVIPGRGGTKGEWRVRAGAAVTEVAMLSVAASESVDFVVDCLTHDAGDSFEWPVTLKLEGHDGTVIDTSDSVADFSGGEQNALPAQDEAGLSTRARETSSSADTPPTEAANKLLTQAVALYRAEGDANDSAGNHHGKLQGDAAIAPIKVGHAFKFAGDGVVVVPDAPDLNPTEQFTMMAWVRPKVLTWSAVVEKSTNDDDPKRQGFEVAIGAEWWFLSNFTAPGEPWEANEARSRIRSYVGRWFHIATTYNAHVLQLYRDGVLVGSREVGRKSICQTDASLTIGGRVASGGLRFSGLIDDVALFDSALSAAEIETIFRGTLGGKEWLTREQEAVLARHTNENTIDVLALVDPARDARSGTWTADLDGLHSPRDSWHAVLRLPVAVPDEYRLTVVAERAEGWKGGQALAVGLLGMGTQFHSAVDWDAKSGLEQLDGKVAIDNESTAHCGTLFHDGNASIVTYTVRRSDIEMLFDGREILKWQGDFRRLRLYDGWKNPLNSPLRLFLGTHCDWHFKAILLTPLTAAKAAPAADEKAATDLLKTIDLQKHARGGWAFDGPVLVSPPNVVHAGVRFPGVVPDEYRLRIVAERPRGYQGPPRFHVGLVTRLSQATLVLDADHKSGLEAIDGKMYHENATTFPGDLFIDGVESTIDCHVDKEGIRVDFDGHTIIDWHGDLKQLAPTWSQFGAPKRTFWIGTHCNYRIKKVELLPLTKE